MGFAEQLAARAAERQSKSFGNSFASSSSSSINKKKRRPRIQPVSDEEFAAKSSSAGGASNAFADQLKRQAKSVVCITDESVTKDGTNWVSQVTPDDTLPSLNIESVKVGAPIPVQMHRLENNQSRAQTKASIPTVNPTMQQHENQPNSTENTTSILSDKDQAELSQSSWFHQLHNLQVGDDQEERRRQHALIKMQLGQETGGGSHQPSERDAHLMQRGDESIKPASNSMHDMLEERQSNKLWHSSSSEPTLIQSKSSNLQPHKSTEIEFDAAAAAPTSRVFGAWAQIESLQLRLKEAEERAARLSRRAEFAELKNVGGCLIEQVDEGYVGDLNVDTDGSTAKQAAVVGGAVEYKVYKMEESGESLETVNLLPEEDGTALPPMLPRHNHQSQNNNTHSNIDNDEVLKWKQRALQAEERLSQQQDYSTIISPHGTASSTGNTPFKSPPKQQRHNHPPALESDLIQLKNNEISILRHQISRLELRIQEECARNSELLQSYHHFNLNHHHEPPIAVAECTSSLSGENHEFRMLRNEIRHLQYQLSQSSKANLNNNRSTQSTTGSTLSSLENEHEEEEEDVEDDGEGQQQGSGGSWLCCVKRSRRGYGRVTR